MEKRNNYLTGTIKQYEAAVRKEQSLLRILKPEPTSVIYYGINIRKKKFAFDEKDLMISVQSLLSEGYKNLEIHVI